MLIFMLAPFSLPVLALTALAAVALLIPAVVGLVLAAPFLLARRRWRSRYRLSGDTKPSRRGDGEARMRRRLELRSARPPGCPLPSRSPSPELRSVSRRGRGEVVMDEREWLTERFQQHRSHLRAVAYRMLGSVSEADDALQEPGFGFATRIPRASRTCGPG
jgi:hypothetical protein